MDGDLTGPQAAPALAHGPCKGFEVSEVIIKYSQPPVCFRKDQEQPRLNGKLSSKDSQGDFFRLPLFQGEVTYGKEH